ncbi:MAG: DNA-binding domain-containing protein, partial [Paracoccaceae bacterium]
MVKPVALRELQLTVVNYLQLGDSSAERLVAEQPPLSAQDRLSIYGSAYTIRLRQALENDHEMLAWYLGDEQFSQLADGYIRKHPSTFTSLRNFGDALPVFLQQETPYDRLPALSELAVFERLMLDVFDAPDAKRAGLPELQVRPADSWPEMRIRFHPSVQLFQARSNAVLIWQALKASRSPPEAATNLPSSWLLWRGTDRLS